MRTMTKGNAAESAVLNAFVESDLNVLVPFGSGQPYDLVVHLPTNRYLRVQCKTARPSGGCLEFNCRATDHGRGRLPYTGLADVFGVYFPPLRAVYLIPVSEVPVVFAKLRLEPARNNQRRRIRFAADYEIGRWTVEALDEIAQAAMRSSQVELNPAEVKLGSAA